MNKTQREALVAALANVNGSTFISIDTLTEPQMDRTMSGKGSAPNPHYGRITKQQLGSSVMVFQNKRVIGYENMVKRRLIEEGLDPESFELSPRRWGQRVPNMPTVMHGDKLYLEVIFLRPGPVQYFIDHAIPINKDEIFGLRETNAPAQGGLTRKVQLRVFDFDSITSVTINKTEMNFY